MAKLNESKLGKQKKLEKIAEILGGLEEKHKSKDWLLDEIKRHKVPLSVSSTTNSFEILKNVPVKFVNHLLKILKDDEFMIEDVKTLSKTMHWFCTDIVGSSDPKLPTKTQARKIIMLNKLIEKTETFKSRDKDITSVQHTGDGVAIGFSESPEYPLRLAIELHKLLNKYNKTKSQKERIYLRIGIDTGLVYFIKDLEGKETTWGPGIITTKRVMDLCNSNQIFTSRRLGDDVSNLSSEYKPIMHPIGNYEIKHGEKLFIYNIFGKGFGNKKVSAKKKVKDKFEIDIKKPNFEFNKVEVKLDVTDPKSMMTHHTWIWDIKNISESSLQLVHYEIFGDTEKDLEDLHVSITDNKGKKIENYEVVNKGPEKKFDVMLKNPLKKNKSTTLCFEYDWEEPYKVFEYNFSAKCKKMLYQFTIPKDTSIKHRVLEVARGLGQKIKVTPQPSIKYTKDKILIEWETDKKRTIRSGDSFEFSW